MSGFAYRLFAALAVAWIPVLIDAEAIEQAARLHPLANSVNPYFVPSHAFLLYLRAPLAALSGIVLCLSPGLILALARKSSSDINRWLVSGFGLSLVSVSVVSGTVQAFLSEPLRGLGFKILLIICSVLSLGFLRWCLGSGPRAGEPWKDRHAPATLLSLVLVPWLLLVVLAPKFYWETFNADGVHAFESSRLLLRQSLPFWDPAAGRVARFPGVTSMLFAFPNSWFIRLFGEWEVSVRLPNLMYLGMLYAAILGTINQRRPRSILIGIPERGLLWLGLVIYFVVIGYSATYDPYSADLALPATQDTLLMVCFLGFLLAFRRDQRIWMSFWIALVCLSLPSGVLLIALWLLSVIWLWRPRPWSRIKVSIAVLATTVVLASLAPVVLAALDLPPPGGEYSAASLLGRFIGPQQGESLRLSFLWKEDYLRRWAFLIFPSGILPAVSLFLWRRQDAFNRALTVLIGAYFLLFNVQAFVALHHFVPVMVLPLVVFWGIFFPVNARQRGYLLAGTAAAGIFALYVSLPSHPRPVTEARVVGAAVEDRFGGYDTMAPAAFRRSEILHHVIPYGWDPSVPEDSYGGQPIVWYYYAHYAENNRRKVNYMMQPATHPAPDGMELLAREGNVELYVADRTVLAEHRALRPPSPPGSPLYAIRRDRLFRRSGSPIIELWRTVLEVVKIGR